ncbi:hypothetical protein EC957_004460 [Mortierella hygrophila]|uniref:Wings apart-like protein C-terminal domain-containing protein n=1 Tax=Mortierella hygrophila TaxID=979708 RepID=A0A9P6F0R0_9FUNG|nr:hypothetical protein EC957_004460 [Mortierella hygrophila]
MPPSPRKGTVPKSRQTYGRQRSIVGQRDWDTSPPSPLEVNTTAASLPRGSSSISSPILKRGGSDLDSPPVLKRAGSTIVPRAPLDLQAALRASHELRETGQNHQFRDEIEYILDGIRTKDRPKIRRTSCLDLARSMLKLEFADLFRFHNYMSVVFETIRTDRDPYNDLKDIVKQSGIITKGQKVLAKSIVLSTMTGIIEESVALQDAETLSLIEQHPDFINTVIDILVDDLAWIKQPSATPGVFLPDVLDIGRIQNCLCILERLSLVSKTPATVLADNARVFPLFVQLITLCRAHAFQYPQHTDSMNLMLHALRLLINVTNGFEPCCENLAQSGSISVLTQNIIQFYGHCRNYIPGETEVATTMSGGQDLMDDVERIHWTRAESRSDSGFSFEMMTPGATPSRRDRDEFRMSNETDDLEAALKAEGLLSSRPSVKEVKIENDANGWYDILLLSIGLLINMLETNVRRRHQLTDQAIGLDCNAIGDCFIRECQCDKSTDALERLVEIYNTEATISEMTENQVLAAYLALLLGCAVGGNPENETRLYQSIHEQSLVPMVDLLRDFMAAQTQNATDDQDFDDNGYGDNSDDTTMTSQGAFQGHGVSMGRSASMMSVTLENESAQATVDGVEGVDQAGGGGISFKSTGGLETQQSFLQIIDVLQRIELRHSEIRE